MVNKIKEKHVLILDPIPFMGGSKIATENILRCCKKPGIRITVLTNDRTSWTWPKLHVQRLYELPQLIEKEMGVLYFIRHFILFANILWVRIRWGKINLAIGASGPGNDLAIYFAQAVLNFQVLQLVLGPVAVSRTIARCLMTSDSLYYLESAENDLNRALALFKSSLSQRKDYGARVERLVLGLPGRQWPTAIPSESGPVLFWAASLYKWKGLDIFLDAIKLIPEENRPRINICYIRPKQTTLDVSLAPIKIAKVYWYETPDNLDAIRAQSSIFVSTSDREPFGLSILEAMAAGLCIVIPRDGAYWDKQLIEHQQCVKYTPGDSHDLMLKLSMLLEDLGKMRDLGLAAKRVAESYRAEVCYQSLVKHIED